MFSVGYFIFSVLVAFTLLMPNTCLKQAEKPPVEDPETPVVEHTGKPLLEDSDQPPVEISDSILIPAPPFSSLSENARIALVLPCGRCHQSTLESHKPGAVAIFDLDAGELWHSDLNEERLNGLGRRAAGNSSLSEEERGQIAEFVAMKRDRLP
jgi:hypothetical protein